MKNFQALLDRYGSDLRQWPREEAEAAKRLLLISAAARAAQQDLARLESMILSTRPQVSVASVRRVVHASALAVRDRQATSSVVWDRLRLLLAAPVPRAAFVMGMTAAGFVLGIALGAPEIAAEGSGGPVLTASADDALF